MSVADLRRLVQRATPRVEDVRSPDRTDFIRREHGHLSLREIVEALDALQFSFASFLRCFAELGEPTQSEGLEEALVLSKEERLKRYCAAQPTVEMSNDTAVHQLHRLLKHVKTLDSENNVPATSTGPSSQHVEWAARATDAPPNWQELVATEKARGGECFKQKDFEAVTWSNFRHFIGCSVTLNTIICSRAQDRSCGFCIICIIIILYIFYIIYHDYYIYIYVFLLLSTRAGGFLMMLLNHSHSMAKCR